MFPDPMLFLSAAAILLLGLLFVAFFAGILVTIILVIEKPQIIWALGRLVEWLSHLTRRT